MEILWRQLKPNAFYAKKKDIIRSAEPLLVVDKDYFLCNTHYAKYNDPAYKIRTH